MQRIAKILSLLLVALLGSGCFSITDQTVYIPQKCHVELSPEPLPEQCPTEDVLAWGKCAYKNFVMEKEHNAIIRKESEVCE